MIEFSPIETFSLGPLPIHTHGLFMALGILIAYILLRRTIQRSGLSLEVFDTAVLWAVIGGLLGARILYVVLNIHFYPNIFEVFKVWEGGLISFGGLVGGLLAAILYLRFKKQPLLAWLDQGMVTVLLGWSIGRIGDLLSWEEIGTPTDLLWGFSVLGDVPRHPAQAYETITLLVLFFLLLWVRKRWQMLTGVFFSLSLAAFSLNRFFIEFVRDYPNSEYLFSYRAFAQGFSVALVLFSLAFIGALYRKHQLTR